ncbi:MAG: hypothetical protein HYY32_06780 [Chloroflexi bacterium]|nr:hypothetical protein [Chloroflexota bacterium]
MDRYVLASALRENFSLDIDIDKWLKSREAKDILDKLTAAPDLIEDTSETDA